MTESVTPCAFISISACKNMHLASIGDSALHLRQLDPFIGALTLDRVHSGTMEPFIEHRRRAGVKVKSINLALGLVRRILNLSARLWRDEHGLTGTTS